MNSYGLPSSVGDPDPEQDLHVFGPTGSGSGSISLRYGSPLRIRLRIRILPFSHKGVEQTEIMLAKSIFNTKF